MNLTVTRINGDKIQINEAFEARPVKRNFPLPHEPWIENKELTRIYLLTSQRSFDIMESLEHVTRFKKESF